MFSDGEQRDRKVVVGYTLEKHRLISILNTPRGLMHDASTGKVAYGAKLMSTYEKKLRILTVMLLGGIFHRDVHLLAMRLYRISVVPDSTIQDVSIDQVISRSTLSFPLKT